MPSGDPDAAPGAIRDSAVSPRLESRFSGLGVVMTSSTLHVHDRQHQGADDDQLRRVGPLILDKLEAT
jgi:hypothetical protein